MITADAAAFAAALPGRGRLAGLDVGTRTIGLATATADWRHATARGTLARTRPAADRARLLAFLQAEGVAGVVVGLPLKLDGSDSDRTRSVRAQAHNLAAASGLPVLLWDERWSTLAVERVLHAARLSRARRARAVDALAAQWILEGALRRLTELAGPGPGP
ncbi:MAG: Holliday junction resolvase RuvX [Sphingomonadaceae bacterium]|uniref:Holliday junction resolvase RuvX n=1 Tax=Thermaurantiacus sp. TaxID=2820283 RepID=UPI00298F2DE4|nr:Holliday junction resolvase RuvX [Thermaurantiacus sp.]MCS6987613.1 Holliday junction resolvase RuvX [Sphingomonadaceae bacterium]MDW8415214.1 Holliday junction resolvase RuvX [Thermaurantiacus sp.]